MFRAFAYRSSALSTRGFPLATGAISSLLATPPTTIEHSCTIHSSVRTFITTPTLLDQRYHHNNHRNNNNNQNRNERQHNHKASNDSNARAEHRAASDATAAVGVSTKDPQIRIIDHAGKEITTDIRRFTQFTDFPDAPAWLQEGIKKLGFKGATDIQSFTMPLLQQGEDVIGLAPTGSGKTVGFAFPALATFKRNKNGNPAILVLAPVRELVQQTARVFRALGGNDLVVCEAYGGESRMGQADKISKGCDVIVACPGRLKDFLDSQVISLADVSFLVLDEADRLLDMGFKVQLDHIMSYIDPSRARQSMMWSATWPKEVQHLAAEFLSPNRIMVKAGTAGDGGAQINPNITQEVFMVRDRSDKLRRLIQIFDEESFRDAGKVIIFVERQSDCEMVAEILVNRVGVDPNSIAALHGGMHQQYRDSIMRAFKNSGLRFLVATDVASRGLDFPDITAVINYEAPKSLDQYCHRIGRTGRAGRKGKAFTFVEHKPSPLVGPLSLYLEKCKMHVPRELAPLGERWDEYEEQRQAKRERYGDRRARRNRDDDDNYGGYSNNNYNNRGNYQQRQQQQQQPRFRNRRDDDDDGW